MAPEAPAAGRAPGTCFNGMWGSPVAVWGSGGYGHARERFPETQQVGGAERPVVEPVSGLSGLPPDHPAVVRAERPFEARLVKGAEHLEHVHAPELARVHALVELA